MVITETQSNKLIRLCFRDPADNIKAEVSDLYITGLCKVWQVLLLQTDDSSTFLYTCRIY